jgi:2-phosphoglycerate kinase
MAKILVTDQERRSQAPFLRGILTHSLQEAGLAFGEAYEIASALRGDLRDAGSISRRELRAMVLRRLRQLKRLDAARRYRELGHSLGAVMIMDHDGQLSQFSRDRHQRRLEACAIDAQQASEVTQRLFEHLRKEALAPVPADRLGRLTHAYLEHELGDWAANRYLVWTQFVRSGRPLILLIGGTAGCGKSTTATMLANRLDVVRTQSTDMLREIMRVMIPKRLLPVLHTSSFNAWKALPGNQSVDTPSDAQLSAGFHAQADLLSVACEAVIDRGITERVSLVLEGVHVNSTLARKISTDSDALVMPVMLAVLDPDQLRRRIRGRGGDVPQRRASRYLEHFDAIWRLQSLLLEEAERDGVPIIRNDDRHAVFKEIMRLISNELSRNFDAKVADLFPGRSTPARAIDL